MSAAATLEIEYPTSDGKPMAETDLQRDLIGRMIECLKCHYADQPNVYVSGNLLVFYEEGNPRRHRSPDCFVVWNVPKHRRKNYMIWEEGQAPGFVIELTSKSTQAEDLSQKFSIYRDKWKVQEYFLFDPYEEYLEPSMQGYRLIDGEYEPIEPNSAGQLYSKMVNLNLERAGEYLLLREPGTNREIVPADAQRTLDLEEELRGEQAARERMEARAKADRERADAEIARLRQEMETLRREQPPGR